MYNECLQIQCTIALIARERSTDILVVGGLA